MRRSMTGRATALAGALLASTALTLPCASQAFAPKPPHAPKPPLASTGGASDVSDSSAVLNGVINPHGTETNYYFQYGPTAAYSTQTPTVVVGAGTVGVKVSQPISGLQLGTAYHYRLVATSSAGPTDGQDRSFTTKQIPLKFALPGRSMVEPYGSPFSIEGTLTGTGGAGQQIVLQSSPFPYLSGFGDLGAPTTTSAAGEFSLRVPTLTQNTELRVSTLGAPTTYSRVLDVKVAVFVTLNMRPTGRKGYVRLFGTVTPSVVGAPVTFQLLRPGLAPVGVSGTAAKRGTSRISRFSSVVFIRHGRGGPNRALVRVASDRLVSGYSRAVLLHSAPASVRRERR
jgi:hypothetical protein